MAIKNEYVLNFKSQGVTKTKQEVDKLDDSTDKLSKTTDSKLSPALGKAKIAIAALGAATIAAAGHAIKTAAEFEKLRTRLNTMYGSVNAGTKAFQTFNKVAATTPFALQSVVEAGAQLKAFGLDAEDTIKPVSDLAAFMGVDIVEAANSMGRAFAGGAGAADVLRERGVLNLIKSFKGVDDLSKLTLPEFRKALIESIQDPTLGIAGATDALSETFVGKYSNMKDAVDRLADAYGQKLLPVIEPIIEFFAQAAGEAAGTTNAFDEQIKSVKENQIALKVLTDNLGQTEKGSAAYRSIINQIKREYPDFLKGLSDEDINMSRVNQRLRSYNSLQREKISILEEEKKRESLVEKQTDLIREQMDSAAEFATNLSNVDDQLEVMFDKAKHKTDLTTEAGQNFVANLDSIRKALTEEEQLYLSGQRTTEEFYQSAIKATKDFENALHDGTEGGRLFNDVLKDVMGTDILPFEAIKTIIGDVGTLTSDLEQSNTDNERAVERTNAQYQALNEIINNTNENIGSIEAITDPLEPVTIGADNYLSTLEAIPITTADAVKGSLKFVGNMKIIAKDLMKSDSALRDQIVGSMGAIAMASAGSKAEQLKVQKFMVKANVAKGIIDIFTNPAPKGPLEIAKAVALSAGLVARGVTQTKTIDEQIANINATKSSAGQTQTRFAQYGMNEVVDQATPIIAGEAGAELVQITPLEGANVDGPQGGGNIVITGNVLSRDFVQGELIDELREAIRQGYDFR
jgi:hypothetical protein